MTDQHKLAELIDAWLLQQLPPEEKARLEHMIANDPVVARMARESQIAFEVLKADQQTRLRKNLKLLDQQDPMSQGFLSGALGKYSLVILLGLVAVIGFTLIRTSSTMATRHFLAQPESCLSASYNHQQAWRFAAQAYSIKDYETAIRSFAILSEDQEPEIRYTAKWNMLMSQLAKDGVSQGWKVALQQYRNEAPEPYKSMASNLEKKLNSWFFRILVCPGTHPLNGLKPPLI